MTDSENELVARLRALFIMDEVGSNNPLGRDAADALEAAWRERDEARSERDKWKDDAAWDKNAARDFLGRAEAAEAEVARLKEILSLLGNSDDPHVRNSVLNFLEDRNSSEAK